MGSFYSAKGFLSKVKPQYYIFRVEEYFQFSDIRQFNKIKQDWAHHKDRIIGFEKDKLVVAGGGGGVLFDRLGCLPLIQRSQDAPTNPGKWTIPTGRFDAKEEIVEPELIFRELVEELIVQKNGQAVDYESFSNFHQKFSKKQKEVFDRVEIHSDDQITHFTGFLSISDDHELNFVTPIISENYLYNYDFQDGEIGENGKRLERDIRLFSFWEIDRLDQKGTLTQHARDAMKKIGLLF